MESSKEISFYEYYHGLEVNGKLAIPGGAEHFDEYQKMILNKLPHTNLEHFEYTSRFDGETDFKHFKGIPKTLKVLELANFHGISAKYIKELMQQGVECHHQSEEYYKDDDLDITDDSQTYVLEDGKWAFAYDAFIFDKKYRQYTFW